MTTIAANPAKQMVPRPRLSVAEAARMQAKFRESIEDWPVERPPRRVMAAQAKGFRNCYWVFRAWEHHPELLRSEMQRAIGDACEAGA